MAYNDVYPQPTLDAAITRGRFKGNVAIVTGGNSGIGRACVERFSNDGAAVAIFARNIERGEAVVKEIRASGGDVKFYQVDVTDKERCVEAVKQEAEDYGGMVHFLVNNHGVVNGEGLTGFCLKNITDTPTETMKYMFDVNVVGTTNMVQACFPFMKNDGKNCAVVNVSSVRAKHAMSLLAAYSASKGALNILTKCMALDLSNVGIRVNSVTPALVWTPLVAPFVPTLEDANKMAESIHMTRRAIDAAGVASAIVFLCSKDAMYIDGADLPVDSGYMAMGPEGLGQG